MFPTRSGPKKREIQVVDASQTLRAIDSCSKREPRVPFRKREEIVEDKALEAVQNLTNSKFKHTQNAMKGIKDGQLGTIQEIVHSVNTYAEENLSAELLEKKQQALWKKIGGETTRAPNINMKIRVKESKEKLEQEISQFNEARQQGLTAINPVRRLRRERRAKDLSKRRSSVFHGQELKVHAVGKFGKDGMLTLRSREIKKINSSSSGGNSGTRLSSLFKK